MLADTRTGRLADDFFLMVHDDLSGRPRLNHRILGLGLAGALLGELAIHGAVDVQDDLVTVAAEPTDQGDELVAAVLRDVTREQRRPVRDWLDYLSRQAPEQVATRLAAKQLVYLKPSRVRRLGAAGRWVPTDSATAVWPAIEVNLKVHTGRADAHHLMLFGLTRATGMNHPALWEIRDLLHDARALEGTLAPLAWSPPLLELLACTEAAVATAVTGQRGN